MHPEMRGHSPHPVAKQPQPFSQAHSNIGMVSSSTSSTTSGSSSAVQTAETGNLRWVGLAGSPRPATAVAPHGHLQQVRYSFTLLPVQ